LIFNFCLLIFDLVFHAIELLRSAAPYDRARNGVVYDRGLAYLAAASGAEAAAQFQAVLDNPANMGTANRALSHVGLARAALLTGDRAKAKKAYQDFLALWKDADPDIPVLIEAKAEYAKLK
jgi:hypothetical protein